MRNFGGQSPSRRPLPELRVGVEPSPPEGTLWRGEVPARVWAPLPVPAPAPTDRRRPRHDPFGNRGGASPGFLPRHGPPYQAGLTPKDRERTAPLLIRGAGQRSDALRALRPLR